MSTSARTLSDEELLHHTLRAARDERGATAVLVAHLAEVDRRGLYRDAGHGSLFDDCVRRLKLSEPAAYARIHAARVSRSYPLALSMLQRGQLHLSALNLLGPKLTSDNHRELLEAACGKSNRQIEALLAERFPAPPVPTVVRKLPQRKTPVPQVALSLGGPQQVPSPAPSSEPEQTATSPLPPRPRPAAAASRLSPLSPERFKLQLTVDRELHDKLQLARQLLGPAAGADLAQVLDRALSLLIEQRMKQRFAQTARPRRSSTPPKPDSRHIPAHSAPQEPRARPARDRYR